MATSAPKAVPKVVPKAGAANASDAPAAAPAATSKKKLILILGAALLLVAGAGGAWFMMHKTADTHVAEKPAPPKAPVFVSLEPFTVNLQEGEGGEQYLQTQFTLQVATPEQGELIKTFMPQVRSRLLLLLSSKKASDINTADGKKKLTEEIIAQVKQPFAPKGEPQDVSNVFFTSFVIQ
ncbi:MAG: flagellar basal body-associated protein FliL [Burkholderiaceae bacterium]